PVPIWNRFQYNRYLPGPKCNADFGASFRCLSQLKTVARQIPRGTCKTAPAPNVNFVLCRSRSLVFSSQHTVKSRQHFTEQAQTELAINLLTEKIPKGKWSKVWLYFAQKDSNIATCSKYNKLREKRGEKARVKGRSATQDRKVNGEDS